MEVRLNLNVGSCCLYYIYSLFMNKFLARCVQKKPEARPTAENLLDDPFIQESVEKLDRAKPRGSSDILKELVENNLQKIEAHRTREAARKKAKKKKKDIGTQGSDDSGITPLYIPT